MKFYPLCVIVICVSGCVQLTEEQRNQITEANTKIISIESRIGKLLPVANELYEKIKNVVEQIAKGELPKEEGQRLINFYKAKRDAVEIEIRAGIAEVKTVQRIVQAINDSGVPWYQQLWLLLPAIIGGAVAVNRQVKLGGATRILGVLSRAGNTAPGFGAKVHEEVGITPGVSRDMTDAAWRRATDREI